MAGAVKVAEVLLLETREPELPFAKDQFTGLLAVNVTVPFSPAEVADGVITKPPLVTATSPVPVTRTAVGDPGWFPMMLIKPVSLAINDGLKLTEIVQLAPEGTTFPHVVESGKSLAFGPAIEIPESERNAVPEFVSVITFAALVVPVV